MKQLKLINPENVSEEEVKSYRTRQAVRAVVLDEENKIALLFVAKGNYYKIPGGGIEEGEDKMIALQRECKEEIGCDVEVLNEIGSITQYTKIFTLNQTSYCYLAKVKGQKGIPNYTDSEKENGFKQVWLPYNEALEMITETKANNIEGGSYIVPRDTAFLEEAKIYLTNLKD